MLHKRNEQSHLGYMMPVLLFVLFFALCAGVLASAFMRSENLSAEAREYNDCVQLCRNAAESFRAGETPEEQGFYDEKLRPAEQECAEYTVTAELSSEDAAAGRLIRLKLRAASVSGGAEYELEVTRYCPGER